MPAYRAEKTLGRCHAAIPYDIVDEVLLVDDASDDATIAVAERLGIAVSRHADNRGYGASQKTCYAEALARGADIVVMLHPDYQYEPRLITAMAAMVASDVYDVRHRLAHPGPVPPSLAACRCTNTWPIAP